MSYCRWIDGDLYIYHSVDGGLVCCACRLLGENGENFRAFKRSDMIAHIEAHVAAGHDVQEYVVKELQAEMELGDEVTEVCYQ